MSVPATQAWTDTGLVLYPGNKVTITASGTIQDNANNPPRGPTGTPGCTANNSIPPGPFVAPGLACSSLIGRIGNGPPFTVGASLTVSVSSEGTLFLGVNDNSFADNSGSWTARLSPA